jgi:hypothetical protein
MPTYFGHLKHQQKVKAAVYSCLPPFLVNQQGQLTLKTRLLALSQNLKQAHSKNNQQ